MSEIEEGYQYLHISTHADFILVAAGKKILIHTISLNKPGTGTFLYLHLHGGADTQNDTEFMQINGATTSGNGNVPRVLDIISEDGAAILTEGTTAADWTITYKLL